MKKGFLVVVVGIALFAGCQPKEITSAKVYIQQKNYPAALEQLKAGTKTYPNNAYGWNLLGQIYGEMDSLKQMNEAFEQALAIDPTLTKEINKWRKGKAQTAFNKGIKQAKKKNYDKAIEWTELASTIDPNNSDIWKNLGYLYEQKDENDKALDAYSKASEIDPYDESIALETTRLTLLVKQDTTSWKGALDILSRVREKKDASPELYQMIAEVYGKLGDVDASSAYYDSAYAMSPDNSSLIYNIAAGAYNAHNYKKSAQFFEHFIELQPDDPNGYYNLAVAYYAADEYEKSRDISRKMTELFPGNPNGWEQLAASIAMIDCPTKEKAQGLAAFHISAMLNALADGNETDAKAAKKEALKYDKTLKDKLPAIIDAAKGDDTLKAKLK